MNSKENIMTVVFFVLMGKGGCGKSVASSYLAQFLEEKYGSVVSIDADATNRSLTAYKALKAIPLELLKNGNIDRRCFDELMEKILSKKDNIIVVDVGAGSFIPLLSYMLENDSFLFLQECGVKVVLNPVVVGGEASRETGNGFLVLAELGLQMITFKNSFFGPVEIDGKPYNEWKPVIEANKKGLLQGVVRIGGRSKDLFGEDIRAMASKKLTFSQAINGEAGFSMIQRQRIKIVRDDLYKQLDSIMPGVIKNDS
jgi:ABC-type dipeptide/oligopeptide/nickel transport system ATPase component